VVVVHGQADLVQVVDALGAGGGVAHLLHRRQEQPQEDRDDGDDDQQLDQREGGPATWRRHDGTLLIEIQSHLAPFRVAAFREESSNSRKKWGSTRVVPDPDKGTSGKRVPRKELA
jgi:hypothetical protein